MKRPATADCGAEPKSHGILTPEQRRLMVAILLLDGNRRFSDHYGARAALEEIRLLSFHHPEECERLPGMIGFLLAPCH